MPGRSSMLVYGQNWGIFKHIIGFAPFSSAVKFIDPFPASINSMRLIPLEVDQVRKRRRMADSETSLMNLLTERVKALPPPRTPNLPAKNLATKIRRLRKSGKFPTDMRIPTLEIEILLESIHLKSRILALRLAVSSACRLLLRELAATPAGFKRDVCLEGWISHSSLYLLCL